MHVLHELEAFSDQTLRAATLTKKRYSQIELSTEKDAGLRLHYHLLQHLMRQHAAKAENYSRCHLRTQIRAASVQCLEGSRYVISPSPSCRSTISPCSLHETHALWDLKVGERARV